MGKVVGIDEVGRGSWAGPLLVVAARAKADLPLGIKDSKLLSKKQRQEIFDQLMLVCEFGEGWVQPEEIDQVGLTSAMKLGVTRALIGLGVSNHEQIIIDGNINYCPAEYCNVQAIIKADLTEPIVSAASVFAKQVRDQHMIRLAQLYPNYGFDQHVGYGTKLHELMLRLHGPSKIHRLSYKPVAKVIALT